MCTRGCSPTHRPGWPTWPVGWDGLVWLLPRLIRVEVDGFDLDESSITIARHLAKEAGVDDRVHFDVRDGMAVSDQGPYDLAIVVESIHDMSGPVEILDAIRRSLAPGGVLLVADERVAGQLHRPWR